MKYKIVYSEDYIAIIKGKREVLGWHEDEWKEDSQVVFSICSAIELAYQDKLDERMKL